MMAAVTGVYAQGDAGRDPSRLSVRCPGYMSLETLMGTACIFRHRNSQLRVFHGITVVTTRCPPPAVTM